MEDARTLCSRKRRRRWLGLLLLLLLPVVLVAGVYLYLQSPAGEALVRAKVLAAVADALEGKVEAKGVELQGNHLVLTDLRLFTPEGELVASIERVEADVDLGALAQQRVHLSQVKVQAPRLLLKQDARGWNLVRAVAAKTKPKGPSAPAGPSGWRVELDGVALAGGLFDLEQADRRVTATRLTATGDARVRLEPLEVTGTLALSSQLTAPLEESLAVTVSAVTSQGPQRYELSVTLGGSRLRAQAELPSLALTVDELVAAPRELAAFLPARPLRPTVYGKGTLSPKQAALQLRAGRAQLSLEAKYDLGASSSEAFGVRASEVDLQELVGASLPSALAFDLSGALTDWRPDTLSGGVKGGVSWTTTGGQPLASATLSASAQQGVLKVERLEGSSPGLTFRVKGSATPTALGFFGTVEAKDLARLGHTLHAFAALDLPGLAGNGTVRVSIDGPPRGPAAKVVGALNQFALAGVQAEKLELSADVPDVSRPLDTDIVLHARRLRFGDRTFEEVTFDFLTHGRELDLDLATKGLGDLKVHAVGILDKDAQGAELQTMELTATDASWVLEAPSRVSWADGVRLSPFAVRDGVQRLSGELSLTRAKLEAKLLVEHVDLARLPHLLALPSLRLGGTLSADVGVTGKPAQPVVKLTAQLRDGRVKGFEAVALDLQGTWRDERAQGTLTLASSLGKLEGRFDVPVLALLDEKPGEATARFELEDVRTQALEQQLGRTLPVSGVLSGLLELSGSGEHPRLRVTVESAALTLSPSGKKVAVGGSRLSVYTTDSSTLEATLGFSALGATHAFTLSTPLTLASLRRHLPTPDELLSLPLTLQLEVKNLNLRTLDELHLVHDDELAGAVSLSGTIQGTVRAPQGELSLTLSQVTWPPVRQADAHFSLRTEVGHTRLTGTASLAQQPALELTATLSAAPEVALAPLWGPKGDADAVVDALREVPLEVLLVLKPVQLAQAMAHEGQTAPGGMVSATLEVGGTLQAPTARLVGAVQDLRFDKVALGSGRFDLKSTGTEQRFTLALGGQGRDDFKAKGTLGLDVRLSALRHGLDWRAAPVELLLESRNFDLGFLSGTTELARVVGGRLDLTGRLSGTLGAPHFEGDASVRGGRLALASFGDFRDIALELHADDDLVEVKKLAVSSGAGSAQLVARAARQPSGAFLLTSTGSADRFPVVADDQLLATTTLRYVLEGDVTSKLVDIRRLELPRVDVELPEVKRKDLQDLQRPKDIIVLRSGARATQRRLKAVKDAAAEGATKQQGLVVRAVLDAPRNLWVRSSDLNVELGLSEGFRAEFNEGLQLFGEARLIQGNIEVIGREFTVQKGSDARFAGLPSQPYVNVSALHVNAREQVKITVSVAGKGTNLGFKATSEPPMPESDIYAVLATGRRNLKSGGGATFTPGQAASVVGQLAASQLKTVIARKLPIDVFNFETTDNFEKVKLDVGKYLSDTVYLGGSVDIGAKRERGENVWAGRLELQLTRSLSLEAYAGDALSFGADAVWSRDF